MNHLFKICQCSEQLLMCVFLLLTLIYCNILESIIACSTMNDTRRLVELLLFRMPLSLQHRFPYSVSRTSYSLSTESTIYHSCDGIFRTGTLHPTTCGSNSGKDHQLVHSYSYIHFFRSCDYLIVMGYFNTQPVITVLKSSSSSSSSLSSFQIYNSRNLDMQFYKNYNNVQFFIFKTGLNNALKCCTT